jgi:hypothetical protein
LKEIFSDVPRIPIESWEVDRNYGLDRGQPSPSAMAKLLTQYYEDRKLLASVGQQCYERIHEAELTWPAVTSKMEAIVKRLLTEPAEKEFKGFGTPTRID